jgi:hypothetical protein
MVVGIVIGGGSLSWIRAEQPSAIVQNGPPTGRYQIVFSPHVRADTFLLDSQTGRIWMQVKMTAFENDPIAWELQDRIEDAESYRAWASHQTKKLDK